MKWFVTAAAILLVSASTALMAENAVHVVQLKGDAGGRRFDGIGVVNGGGATSVLLKDYPEPQRSQILDLVYKPKFGASVSALLVEIPGDGNATQGSMPSHMHTRDDLDYSRGYIWWVLREAKKRNPNLTLDGTAWGAPGWVGHGNFWSQDAADYYVKWLLGLRNVYGLEFDAIGCRNEKGVSYDFVKKLRTALNTNGFEKIKIHAFDNWPSNKLDFVADMANDAELRDAIDIISAHTLAQVPASGEVQATAAKLNKPIWNTEEHVYLKGFDCAIGIVRAFNENFLRSGVTKTVNWYDIAALYPTEPYSEDPAMLLAWWPWSGHYQIREALWGYAHYGQFTEAGWQYLNGGCGTLTNGGSFVTLKSPGSGSRRAAVPSRSVNELLRPENFQSQPALGSAAAGDSRAPEDDYSIIIETKGAKAPQQIRFEVSSGLSAKKLCVWRSNAKEQFIQLDEIIPATIYPANTSIPELVSSGSKTELTNGIFNSFTLTLEPDSIYSISTTSGQQKGSFAEVPEAKPFPFPYLETFDEYASPKDFGYLPRYTADIADVFEIVERPDKKGKCLRQVIPVPPISWAPEYMPYTILGDADWRDYEMSADVWLNPGDTVGVMGRINHVGYGYGSIPKGYFLTLGDDGQCKLVAIRGKPDKKKIIGDAEQQALIKAQNDDSEGGEKELGAIQLTNVSSNQWHNLKLRFAGDVITGLVDDKPVLTATNALYAQGMAGLRAGSGKKKLSTPYFDNVLINRVGAPLPKPATALLGQSAIYK